MSLARMLTLSLAVMVLGLSWVGASPAQAQCVSGTVTAEFQNTGPFAGLYKYTLEVTWDLPQGASNITLDCGFSACQDAACNTNWIFDTPSGNGTGGEPDGCDFDLAGQFFCDGFAKAGIDYPIIKWDVVDTGDCVGGTTGSAVACFYTDVPPLPGQAPIALIKNSSNICEGIVTGDCPLVCPVSSQPISWGNLKFRF